MIKLDIEKLSEKDRKELEYKTKLIEKEIGNIKAGETLVSVNDGDPLDHIKKIIVIGQNLLIELCDHTIIKMNVFKLWFYKISIENVLELNSY